MALALVLLFDAVASAAVSELWDEMAARGISTSMTDLGYPPHLTLITVDDETLAPVLDKGVAELAKDARLDVTLGPVGRFAETDVVWLGCDGAGLLDLHAQAAALVGDEEVSAHYRPGAWVPHVTLQTAGHADEAERFAAERWTGLVEARTAAVELVRFSPIVTLRRLGL